MQPVLTSEESRAFDRYLTKDVGISPLVLMENAARGALASIDDWLKALGNGSILIFCGKGNNGGDGLALARLLHERNTDVYILIAAAAKDLSRDALTQYNIVKKLLPKDHIYHYPIRDSHFISHIDVRTVVDALLGTGVKGAVKGRTLDAMLDLVGIAKHFNAKVLAVDVPTGLNADTGACETTVTEEGITYTVCVTADRTVTMGARKLGFYLDEGPERVGELSVAPLGASAASIDANAFLVEASDIKSLFAPRKRSTSKFDYGHVLSISGSRGMTGAAIMTATGALRVGAGLVSVATPSSERHIVASAMPELMTVGLWHDEEGLPLATSLNEIQHYLGKATVIHYGSGITLTNDTHEIARRLLREVEKPLVLDAGALTGLKNDHQLFRKRKAPIVITPHSGEMAALLGTERDQVESDRIGIARTFAEKNKTIVVLKGAPATIAIPSGNVYINSAGNPGMATAGVGDVLGGMIAGLIAQHDDVEKAVLGAVYLHGLAGDIAKEKYGEVYMSATDLIRHIPQAIAKINE